jgi:hypothetical protein
MTDVTTDTRNRPLMVMMTVLKIYKCNPREKSKTQFCVYPVSEKFGKKRITGLETASSVLLHT